MLFTIPKTGTTKLSNTRNKSNKRYLRHSSEKQQTTLKKIKEDK